MALVEHHKFLRLDVAHDPLGVQVELLAREAPAQKDVDVSVFAGTDSEHERDQVRARTGDTFVDDVVHGGVVVHVHDLRLSPRRERTVEPCSP